MENNLLQLAEQIKNGKRLSHSDNLSFFETCELTQLCKGADSIPINELIPIPGTTISEDKEMFKKLGRNTIEENFSKIFMAGKSGLTDNKKAQSAF